MDSISKKIIIIAGPNGAWKTTFARAFLPAEAHCNRFINADLIAAGLSPFAPESAAFRAGRLMLKEIRSCVENKESFAFETTLSGLAYLHHIQNWRNLGYHVSLFFLSLPSSDMAVARVAERVRQGGHDIPEAVIQRRFEAGKKNFEHTYRTAVDAWALFDNKDSEPLLIAWGERT
ncbi:MAG: Zeta toxin family protein [Sulfuriferula sp.]|nr:Zeta toxin family protein [Sulfuriferula sp.]